jgi:stage II sporulation protein AA (anti-sigma F factor antagonist)
MQGNFFPLDLCADSWYSRGNISIEITEHANCGTQQQKCAGGLVVADLTFHVEKLTAMETAALVKINGAIDAKTVVLFQEKLDQLQKDGYTRFILDMEGIKYVNSTGLGTLVNVADALETRGGGIALIKIHPKVKVVFDMLGLNAFFKIFSNEKEALNYFGKAAGASAPALAPAPAPAPVHTSAPAPAPVHTSSPAPVPTVHIPLSQAPSTPPATSRPQTQTMPPQQTATSPSTSVAMAQPPTHVIETYVQIPSEPGISISLVCAVCKVKLTIPRPGSFKCPRCATFFKLAENGKVVFSERKKSSPLQMKLCCTEECTQGLSEFIGVLANRIGFLPSEIQAIKECLAETCTAVTEKAYENKQYLSYNVVINPSSTELKVQISDYGKFIYDEKAVFSHGMRTMDEFEHKQHPKGGNIINMVKRVH